MSDCDGDCTACGVPGAFADTPEWQAAGVFVKLMPLAKRGDTVAQHVHAYEHTTLLVRGRVLMATSGRGTVIYDAPAAILIRASVAHSFEALADDTALLCVHDVSRTGGRVEVAALHPYFGGASCRSA